MNDIALAEQFEANRPHLRSVGYRMLGSLTEADDAVQEAWLRLTRSDAAAIDNLGGWLTTVVSRICLDRLRSREARAEESLDLRLPELIVTSEGGGDPEQQALLADSVGLALLVVLDTLEPAERLAFVLHDVFAVPFDEIASIVERSPAATRQLASRARRRVRVDATPDADLPRQREVVNAFIAAARDGDFAALLAVLDPDVLLRVDAGAARLPPREIRGAQAVASQATSFARADIVLQPVLVNGAAGVVSWLPDGTPLSLLGFTIAGGRIVEIHAVAGRARLAALDLTPPTA